MWQRRKPHTLHILKWMIYARLSTLGVTEIQLLNLLTSMARMYRRHHNLSHRLRGILFIRNQSLSLQKLRCRPPCLILRLMVWSRWYESSLMTKRSSLLEIMVRYMHYGRRLLHFCLRYGSEINQLEKANTVILTYCSTVWKAAYSRCIHRERMGVWLLGYSALEMGHKYGWRFSNSITFCLGRSGALKIWWTGVEGVYTWTVYCTKDVGYSGMLIPLWFSFWVPLLNLVFSSHSCRIREVNHYAWPSLLIRHSFHHLAMKRAIPLWPNSANYRKRFGIWGVLVVLKLWVGFLL